MNNLKEKLNENYKTVVAEHIKSTETYLIEKQSEALKKLSQYRDEDQVKINNMMEKHDKDIGTCFGVGALAGVFVSVLCFGLALAYKQLKISQSN